MQIIPSSRIGKRTQSIVVFVFEDMRDTIFQESKIPARIRVALKKTAKHFPHEALKVSMVPLQSGSIESVLLVHLGKKKDCTQFVVMRAFRAAVRAAVDAHQTRLACIMPDLSFSDEAIGSIASQSMTTGVYSFSAYRNTTKKKSTLTTVELVFSHPLKDEAKVKTAIRQGTIVAEEINAARTISNTPGGDMTPTLLAQHAKHAAKRSGFRVQVLEEKEIKRLGMGGLLGVSRGSSEPAKCIVCHYVHRSARSEKPIVLVGKGITFDTGGLNIKPEMGMYEMHLDMSGGAAVIHTLAAIARLRLPVNVIGIIPTAENMPGSSGYRPGDILRTISGKTIEVKHTDAEGRIILADALGYAKKFKPETIIDIATLAGSTMMALGQRASAVLSPDQELVDQLIEAGQTSGDRVWQLPLWPEFKTDLVSDFADIANIGKTRFGGTIIGATFLWEFAPIDRWAHIDIASTMTALPEDQLAPGSKGSGVALLVTFIKQQYAKRQGKK